MARRAGTHARAVAALALGLAGCAPARPQATAIAVHQGAFVVDVRTTATVEPLVSAPIALPPGLWQSSIEKLAPEGKHVKRGELVATVASRHVIDDLLSRQDDLAAEEATLQRLKADAPVRRWEVKQDIVDHERALREKTLQEQAVLRGGAPEEVAGARRDVRLQDLALANDPLDVKQRLYEKGIIGRQELEEARRDHDLAELEHRRAELALAILRPGADEERLEQARLDAEMAKSALARAHLEAPAKQGLIRLEQDKSRVRIAGLKREVANLQAKVDATKLYAPASGQVLYPLIWGEEKAYEGMQVWPGLVFMAVARLDAVKLTGAVSEAEIANVQVGERADITADGYPGRIFPGKVVKVGKLAKDERRGSHMQDVKRFDVEVQPDGPTPELKPNMRVDLRLIARELKAATSIPADALFGDGDARYVWLESPRGPQKVAVKPSLWGTDWVALAAPLPADSRVYLVDPTRPIAAYPGGGEP